MSTMKRATLFEFAEYIEQYGDELRDDLDFLLQLLTKRQIRPGIDRFISLQDIPAAHNEILNKPLTGTIVCEPWNGY